MSNAGRLQSGQEEAVAASRWPVAPTLRLIQRMQGRCCWRGAGEIVNAMDAEVNGDGTIRRRQSSRHGQRTSMLCAAGVECGW